MTTDETQRWAALMTNSKIARVHFADGSEIEMHQTAFIVVAPAVEEKSAPAPIGIENGGEPTDDQALFWSAGGDLPPAPKATT